jgi:plastocyanin
MKLKRFFALVLVNGLLASFDGAVASTFTVVMGPTGNTFNPATLSVGTNDTVVWTNASAVTPHTATSGSASGVPNGLWDSGTINGGSTATFALAFTSFAPNAYPYFCTFHATLGMTGTITVTNGSGMPPGPTNQPPTTNFAGPFGQYTNTVSDPSNSVWDITEVFNITNVDSVVLKDGVTNAIVDYTIALQQNGAGKISGTGSTTVNASFDDQGVLTAAPPFTGAYRVVGTIASSRGQAHGFLQESVAGATLIAGKDRNVKSTHRVDFKFDNLGQTSTAKLKDLASAAGLGSGSSRSTNGPVTLSSVIVGDGSWTLTMSLSTTGNKITGSGVVTLNTGRTISFTAKGGFNSRTQLSKLVLAGSGLDKGSLLQVAMDAGAVTSIKGRILGQTVNATF